MLSILLIGAGCAVAVYRWRWGVFAAIMIVLVQDPIRKMIPGTPGFLAMATLPIWITTVVSALFSGEVRVGSFLSHFPKFARWIGVLGVYLLIPAVLSGTYGRNSWQITLLGAVVYSSAFFVLAAGWRFSEREDSTKQFISFYAICTSVVLIGGPLDYFGVAQSVAAIGTQALDTVWMTARTGEIVYMCAGFFRSPDVMGWHAATVTMIASVMAVRSRGWMRSVWVALSIWGLMNVWICGRRKMISMLPVFWGVFLLLTFKFRDVKRTVPIAGILLVLIGLGWYAIAQAYKTTAMDTFYMTTFESLDDSVWGQGVETAVETARQAGFFGYGLGMGQQGIHHIDAETPRLWQESGTSRVVAELGVPGALLLLGAGTIMFMTLYHVIEQNSDTRAFYILIGLFSILIANVAASVVSGQIYGDPFVMLFLVFCVGLILSGSRAFSHSDQDMSSEA